MTKAMLCAFLLAVAVVAASAFPLADNWASFSRNPGAANRVRLQQQLAQCDIVTPAAIVCQSARLTYNKNHSYIHVCPVSGGKWWGDTSVLIVTIIIIICVHTV